MREDYSRHFYSLRHDYQGDFSEKDEETGWNHFELREYDAVIGRWTAVDPYRVGFSPYIGMGNNPLGLVDPDGGKPSDWFRGSNGDLKWFDRSDDSFKDNGITWSNTGIWAYGGGDFAAAILEQTTFELSMISAPDLEEDLMPFLQSANNFALGATGTAIAYKGKFLNSNELWHKLTSGKKEIRWRWQTSKWNNPGAIRWRNVYVNKVKGLRSLGNKLGIASLAFTGIDIYSSKEIRASHALNTFMTGISFTGLGAVVSGSYFMIDTGFTIFTGSSLGDRLDNAVGKPIYSWEE